MTDVNTSKKALVVGAASGIGRATALRLASMGITTAVADLNADAVRELAKENEHIVGVGDAAWDATDPGACERLVEETVTTLGRLDHVISTVGWTAITPFLEETPEYWRKIVDLNLMSGVYLAAAAGRALRDRGGSIVLTASEAGKVGMSGESVYSAAKGGVIALVKSLAREWARHGIRVNAVAPGISATPLLEEQGGDALLEKAIRGVPMRRVGRPEEIAAALTFIALDDASYITGQTLCVGGGLTMTS
ncbi:SDR family NAD(P)-dependent oxidoreductase [Streptomyces luomodiensis]|uniref:SDR family NAD(P)-dependent oxidoreductase n=1 Tax=Streptomyces luomodiensis TaxID=3026192 RepID=A0ABY9V8M8_9ACTN|nr:SDR family oxidoreductase [Streptomyces sp. SCA4-21]WNF00351.1 SDR family NAD(P)-dependent oxidoreductase [Streptomyces sp. SCA4-21]